MSPTGKHTLLEDAQGMTLGVFFCALGVAFLTTAGLITGQTAGIAVIIAYLTGWSFGLVFFFVNLPFYVLAWRRMGPMFTFRSLLSVTALSLMTEVIPGQMMFATLSPGMGAIASGALIGSGLLVLFRHNGSLGGLGVLALIIQDNSNFKAGYVQLTADAVIFGVAFLLFPATIVIWSLLGALVLNLIITFNHRRDRYIAT